MVKYLNYALTFAEVPDEINLCFNITNCQQNCTGCHTPILQQDVGQDLNKDLQKIINQHKDQFTCVCFLGEGNDKVQLQHLIDYIKNLNYKVCVYSGRDDATIEDYKNLDYYKIGSYNIEKGPLTAKTTNQKMYKKMSDSTWVDITFLFWPIPM